MFGFFKEWATGKLENIAKNDLEKFLKNLYSMPKYELASVLAIATHLRNTLYNNPNVDLLDPLTMSAKNPGIIFQISNDLKNLQKKLIMATENQDEYTFTMLSIYCSSLMVWTHTLRCGNYPGLAYLGREMWKLLIDSTSKIDEAKINLMNIFKIDMNITGYDEIPKSLG